MTTPFLIEDGRIAYCDVDQTLVIYPGDDGYAENTEAELLYIGPYRNTNIKPLVNNIQLLCELRAIGFKLVLWSQGGAFHCQRTADLLGITHLFDIIIAKPQLYIDDKCLANQDIRRVFKK